VAVARGDVVVGAVDHHVLDRPGHAGHRVRDRVAAFWRIAFTDRPGPYTRYDSPLESVVANTTSSPTVAASSVVSGSRLISPFVHTSIPRDVSYRNSVVELDD
jgi:hypothetical protein